MYVIVTMGGVGLLGPFQTEMEAINYAKKVLVSTRWMVRPIYRPEFIN